ncbi:MAG: hypothetical protein JKY09_04535 [Crocinitomicaceae bacterium]|nr:hypothetical protein [Crocinitomicaceae bacterium]
MRSIILILILFLSKISSGQSIAKILFENLTRTKSSYLCQLLNVEIGDTLVLHRVEEDAQYLRDLNLFFDVSYRIDPVTDSSVNVYFIISEAKYVYPIVSNVTSDQKVNFSMGITDINFLGRGQTIGLFYQYYDRHSFKLYQSTPRHKNNRTGHEFVLGKHSTIEPLYFNDTSVLFNFDNYHVSSGFYFWLNRYWKTSLGGMLMYENYVNRDHEVSFGGNSFGVGKMFDYRKYQLRSTLSYSKVSSHFERRNGLAMHTHLENIQTLEQPDARFWKLTNELRYYKIVGKRGNLAIRNQLGIATNRKSPFAPFVIDGFMNIRGSGDRIARGTGEWVINAEYVHSVIRNKWMFCQVSAFTDVGFLRPPEEDARRIFEDSNTYHYSGIGLRFQSRVLYKVVVRFDYGVNMKNLRQGGFVMGFNHFF